MGDHIGVSQGEALLFEVDDRAGAGDIARSAVDVDFSVLILIYRTIAI